MKFVSYNIQYGYGQDDRYDLARTVDAIADADVIALQEVERHWDRTGNDDQPALIAAMLPEHYWVYGPAFDMDASFRDDNGKLTNQRRQFGTMVLSRLPIVWSRLHCLPMWRVTNPLNTQNPALEAMIRTPWGPIRIFSLHLSHISVEERLAQIDWLMAREARVPFEGASWCGTDDEPERHWTHAESEPENPVAAILMGDFNSVAQGAEYHRIVGAPQQTYAPGATHYAGRFVDAWVVAGHDPGEGITRDQRIDYCFIEGSLAHRIRRAWIDNDTPASDHHPVWTEIDLDAPVLENQQC